MDELLGNAVGVAIASLFGWGMRWLTAWLRSKAEREAIDTALTVLEHAVETSVREVEQVVVPQLREGAKKLSQKQAGEAKGAAVDRTARLLGEQGLKQITKGLGLTKGASYDLMRSKVESAVHRLKR